MSVAQKTPILLITGTVGVGKSSVADEVFEVLKTQSRPVALVNLDELGYAMPRPEDDPFNIQLQLRNLAAIWPNYKKAGTKALIIPSVVEGRSEIDRFREAVPDSRIFVIRLKASTSVIENRIRSRFLGGSMEWHLRRAVALEESLTRNPAEDLVINTDDKAITEVAREVIANWKALTSI